MTDNLDIEQFEQLLDQEQKIKKKDNKEQTHALQEGNSNNISNDANGHSSRHKHRHRSRSRSGRHKSRRHKDKSNSSDRRARDKEHERKRQQRELEYQQRIQEDRQRQQQIEQEQNQRDDCTVLLLQLHPKVVEKDIYQFFIENPVGKIRDIRVIRDQKSGKSKGVAYVEFYEQQSVYKAVMYDNRLLYNYPVRIQTSGAEKNRAYQQSKTYQYVKGEDHKNMGNVYITGLTGILQELQEADIQKLFHQFGPLSFIDLRKDPNTGKCIGYALAVYENPANAKDAIRQMNGFKINGIPIKVSNNPKDCYKEIQNQQPIIHGGHAQQHQDNMDYEDNNTFLHGAQSRYELMQKLTRGAQSQQSQSDENEQNQNQQQMHQQQNQQQYAEQQKPLIQPCATAGHTASIAGKKIVPEANVFIKNLDPSITVKQLESIFSMYGNVLSAKVACDPMGNPQGHGFVQFESVEEAETSIRQASNTKLKGSVIQVLPFISKQSRVDTQNNLYVKNLPSGMSTDAMEHVLVQNFGKYGRIVSSTVKMEPNLQRFFAFICFESQQVAEAALQGLQGKDIFNNGQGIYVGWAETKQDRMQRGIGGQMIPGNQILSIPQFPINIAGGVGIM